jgi:hypothetical protein
MTAVKPTKHHVNMKLFTRSTRFLGTVWLRTLHTEHFCCQHEHCREVAMVCSEQSVLHHARTHAHVHARTYQLTSRSFICTVQVTLYTFCAHDTFLQECQTPAYVKHHEKTLWTYYWHCKVSTHLPLSIIFQCCKWCCQLLTLQHWWQINEIWVWSNDGMILTGEHWSTGRGTLYSVWGKWMNEYGAMAEW